LVIYEHALYFNVELNIVQRYSLISKFSVSLCKKNMYLEDLIPLAPLRAYKLIGPGLIEARHSVDHGKTNLAAVALRCRKIRFAGHVLGQALEAPWQARIRAGRRLMMLSRHKQTIV
jgi:hypothetical protein